MVVARARVGELDVTLDMSVERDDRARELLGDVNPFACGVVLAHARSAVGPLIVSTDWRHR